MVPNMWSVMDRILCYFGPFWAFTPLATNLENQNFEKMKKTPGDIIILHMWTLNNNHMTYDASDM